MVSVLPDIKPPHRTTPLIWNRTDPFGIEQIGNYYSHTMESKDMLEVYLRLLN